MSEVTVEVLESIIQSANIPELKKALKNLNSSDRVELQKNILTGQFRQGRTPFIHQVTFPSGAQLRLKFYNTVKRLFDSKGVERVGKESYLSYIEVTGVPVGAKGFWYTTDVNQVVWNPSKTKATVQHEQNIESLKAFGASLGLDLNAPTAWATQYTENY